MVAILIPLTFVACLVGYKWNGSIAAIQRVSSSGVLSTRTDVVEFGSGAGLVAVERSLNYLAVIWPAMAFGILIGAAVQAFVRPEWLIRVLGIRGLRGQITAGLAAAPLMLCSCCVVPVFNAAYERTSRLAPSIALMLGSPALNPAALVLTFMLFSPGIAGARLIMAATAVLCSGLVIERLLMKAAPLQVCEPTAQEAYLERTTPASVFVRSLYRIILRTIPALVIGVFASMLLVQYVPKEFLNSNGFQYLAIIVMASVAVPLALPTFFEIPLALGLLAAGAPAGAAVALLFAGPVINLPSLLALAKATSWKISLALALFIWTIAVAGGLLVT